MNAVLVSIHPEWCGRIASGEKTVEVRKSRPNLNTPFKCYIYETRGRTETPWIDEDGHLDFHGRGQVIGEFVCGKIDEFDSEYSEWAYSVAPPGSKMPMSEDKALRLMQEQGCLSLDDIINYFGDAEYKAYLWHISDLFIYDKPMELSDFMKPCKNDLFCEACAMYHEFEERCGNGALMIKRAPQSWCYVEEVPANEH